MSERASAPAASERRTRRWQLAVFWQELWAGFREELQADLSRLLEPEPFGGFLVGGSSKRLQLQLRPIPIRAQDTIATLRRPRGQYR